MLEAIVSFRSHLEEHPRDGHAWDELAQCLSESEQHDAALTSACQAVELLPNRHECWLTKARCEVNLGKLREAMSSYKESLKLMGEDEERENTAAELRECEVLLQQSLARRIGLQQLRIRQGADAGLGPGHVVWESGICLAEYLCNHYPGVKQGRSVLELGCGTGIVGIVASLLGFSPVVISDYGELQSLAERNIQDNQNGTASRNIRFAALEWNSMEADISRLDLNRQWDVILLADPVYSETQIQSLSNALHVLLSVNRHAEILMAYADRHDNVTMSLFTVLKQCNRAWKIVASSQVDKRVKVFSVFPQCCASTCEVH